MPEIKPPGAGKPCNSCGVCCMMAICEIGAATMGRGLQEITGEPCPALVKSPDGKVTCGMIETPQKYAWTKNQTDADLRASFALMIGSGNGCDYNVDETLIGERIIKTKSEDYTARVGDKIIEAATIWFGPASK